MFGILAVLVLCGRLAGRPPLALLTAADPTLIEGSIWSVGCRLGDGMTRLDNYAEEGGCQLVLVRDFWRDAVFWGAEYQGSVKTS